MHSGTFLFSQFMAFLPRRDFDRCVRQYRGNYRTRRFSCFDQWLCMAFAQLTYRTSLRDIETCLNALKPKLYHAGFRGTIGATPWPRPTKTATGASTPISPASSSAAHAPCTRATP